jgi:hypothetical protein
MPRRGDLIEATKVNGHKEEIEPHYGLYYAKHTAWIVPTKHLGVSLRYLSSGATLDEFRILVPVEFM